VKHGIEKQKNLLHRRLLSVSARRYWRVTIDPYPLSQSETGGNTHEFSVEARRIPARSYADEQAQWVATPIEIGSPAYLLGATPDPAGAAVADMEQSGQTAAVVQVKPLQSKGRFIFVGYRVE
jgi:hypothetical protein